MGLTYFKRYRMEIDLADWALPRLAMPAGYRLLPWNESLLDTHADVKYRSFQGEIDANVFPCLGEQDGCRRLMQEIVHRKHFIPQATWLAVFTGIDGLAFEACGTVQGVRDRNGLGSIQNLGIVPEHRNLGLGSVLLARALTGFRQAGLSRAYLEVTAENTEAIRLYRRRGLTPVKTVFKAAEVAYS